MEEIELKDTETEADSFIINILNSPYVDGSMNDTYFVNKLNSQLQSLKHDEHTSLSNGFVSNGLLSSNGKNTPMYLSKSNSCDSHDTECPSPHSEYQLHDEIVEQQNDTPYKLLTFQEVEKSIGKYYDFETKYSNEFDLLVTYLNGQKHLYIQCQKITQTKLNILIVPSLVMSATITLFLPLSNVTQYWWTSIFVSVLNAAITLLISLINYYKLESSQELYGQMSKKYEKLQVDLEFKNNRLLFIDKKDQKKYILKETERLEKKMIDIKNSAIVLIPEEINQLFPIIYHINIFSVIKKIENYRTDLIYKFRDVKNEIRYILNKTGGYKEKEQLQKRLNLLLDTKEKIRKQIISYKNSYHDIDSLFNTEIKFAESYRNYFLLLSFCFCRTCLKRKIDVPDDINEIYQDILYNYL